jgi:phospholipid/cholesterol/gamma-HCH transport system ATP-binding protein
MISIACLTKSIAGTLILDGLNLEIRHGEIVAIIGPSGTGKSVLLKHVVGLMQPDAGDVMIDGSSIVRARSGELSRLRRRVGYVFQDAALLDSLTIEENLRLALDDRLCARQPERCRLQVQAALEAVNLDSDVLRRLPGELSGGMRKRVGVARALIHEPDIVLYDEPTTGLDPQNINVINEVIIRSRERHATSLVVTHDLQSIPTYADRVVLLSQGKMRFDGTPAEFIASGDPLVRSFTSSPPEKT